MNNSRYDRKKRQDRRRKRAKIIDLFTIILSIIIVLLFSAYNICTVEAKALPEDFLFNTIKDKKIKPNVLFEMKNAIYMLELETETETESKTETEAEVKKKSETESEIQTESETETETETELESEIETEYIGEFMITAYCACTTCCGPNAQGITASGAYVQENYTIAVDPSVIPLGTLVMINGNVYEAQDTGGGVGGNHIDIYMPSHWSALQWGVQYKDVYLVK